MANAPHHRSPRYVRASALVRRLANADPHAVCWRDGRTLPDSPPHRDGTPSTWTAGHTIDGSTTWHVWPHVDRVPPPGDWLAPECSSHNASHGASAGNRKREPHTSW